MHTRRNRLQFMGLSALMAAFLCVLCPIAIPMGALPITFSVVALFLVASLSPMKVALTATAVYLAVGAVGLPVFSSFTGGAYTFLSPSGGFLWGYLPAAMIVSGFCRNGRGRLWVSLLGMLAALLVLYAFGLFGFCVLTDASFFEALAAVLIFLLPDVLKIVLVLALNSLIYPRFLKRLLKS